MPRDQPLDRHAIDRVARAVVSGRRGHGRALDRLADEIAALMRGKLEAAGAPGAAHAPRRRPGSLSGSVRRRVLVERATKHLAGLVVGGGCGGADSR